MTKVIKNWNINEAADSDGVRIDIVGRNAGLISWFMSLVGLDTTDELKVTEKRIEFTSSSLFGKQSSSIPISKVTNIFYGYSKPLYASLFYMLVFVAIGFASMESSVTLGLFFMVLGLGLSMLTYSFGKVFTVGFGCGGKNEYGISFKRSMIENKKIDESEAEKVSRLIHQTVDLYQK